MAYRRRRRKISTTEFLLWPLVLLAALATSGLIALPHPAELMGVGVMLALVLLGTVALVSLELRRQRKVRQGLRELDQDRVDAMTGVEFERYVGALLEERGFRKIRYTALRNDDGIDIIAQLGKARYAVQAKRYSSKVGKEHIFPVTSARDALGFDEAMVVTNSSFTKGAQEYAKKSRCWLVDREELARWRVGMGG